MFHGQLDLQENFHKRPELNIFPAWCRTIVLDVSSRSEDM